MENIYVLIDVEDLASPFGFFSSFQDAKRAAETYIASSLNGCRHCLDETDTAVVHIAEVPLNKILNDTFRDYIVRWDSLSGSH
jgi:hypothetical protein